MRHGRNAGERISSVVQELKEKEISRLKNQKDAMLKEDARLSSWVDDDRPLHQDSGGCTGVHCYTLVTRSSPCHMSKLAQRSPQLPDVHMFKEKYLEAKALKARIAKLEL